MASGNLSFRLVGDVLTGTGPGTYIHAVTRPAGGTARPPAGRYQILKPILHPWLGRVAVVVPLQEWVKTTTALSSVAPNVLSGYTLHPAAPAGAFVGATSGRPAVGPGAAKAGNAMGPTTVGSAGGAASFSPHQGFILIKDNVAAPNAVAVLSGFDELMDALESSGGAILEIVS
jgi:hypothetical protein